MTGCVMELSSSKLGVDNNRFDVDRLLVEWAQWVLSGETSMPGPKPLKDSSAGRLISERGKCSVRSVVREMGMDKIGREHYKKKWKCSPASLRGTKRVSTAREQDSENISRIVDLMEKMRPDYFYVICYRYIYGCSIEISAAFLGMSATAFKMRLREAKAFIAGAWSGGQVACHH